ncbi:SGNH/GDSL hydrolase family protein [Draconibacterium sp. IB214405]|uniref:SGNH/GDSL hydrolase family protein n=1 Tax=Draconibacterium sp. IB214405 TaxID=3097352 RepID=UPI002A0EAE45|nr:SGNH/GDSL hydrolase family protein [Draconibacterium sp. IB214405]MDX8340569.1 SGNH/GDSL hydrolase family protein [Draconibacterium sp. IB214405]
MKQRLNLILLAVLISISALAKNDKIKWWNPAKNSFDVIDGQGWQADLETPYDRLPTKAKATVRDAVWNLSKHTAGLKIRFRTNASEIKVKYQIGGNLNMPHMPSTGVSGLDLYAKNADGEWIWCRGHYSFGDTITYEFRNITPNDQYHQMGREYHLYLPLYNSVKWMEIGVADDALFEPIPLRQEKPIVVYGTSIAQGGCASRPGMAWTSLLERKMDNPLINLAFSGNGRLEDEVAELIAEIDAKVYILDCLPNLTLGETYSENDVYQKVENTVKILRSKSSAPILLVEHAGYGFESSNIAQKEGTKKLNAAQAKAFADLMTAGYTNMTVLTQEELNLDFDSYVDGVHPTDRGMEQYALAYEKKLREFLNEPKGSISTTIPITQSREPGNYNWEARHNKLLEMNKNNPPKVCFIGNSITHYWGGQPDDPRKNGQDSWDKYLGDLSVHNFGYGWDRVENVLWRIYHEELDGFQAEQIVFMLGTNNLHLNTDEEITTGLQLVYEAVKACQPHARILILGIYPRRDNEERVAGLNLKIAQLAGKMGLDYSDVGTVLLQNDGKIDETLFSDGLHPNADGYNKLAPKIRELLLQQ